MNALESRSPLLLVNNIKVVYNKVVLVLREISLRVGDGDMTVNLELYSRG